MLIQPTLRLPAGMRDFAPEATRMRRRIAEALLGVFERWGFARVITPTFEYEDVLALGLGAAGRAAAIRFVEPSSGQVVALPPDITPQIARLVATRFHDEPGPIRLCYEGTVVRLESRTRAQRAVIQAGVEMAGVSGPAGDVEIVLLAAAALDAVGLGGATIDLGHLGLAREVIDALDLPDEAKPAVRGRIAKRDTAGLREVLSAARGPRAVVEFAQLLPELSGPPGTVATALRRAPNVPAGIRTALRDLAALVDRLAERDIPAKIHIDLGEVRGWDYYTGVRILGFVDGAPDAILQGGRYDGLLARYGRPLPAVGFAIDVEATASALEALQGQGNEARPAERPEGGAVLVTGSDDAAFAHAEALRRAGRSAAVAHASLPGALQGSALAAYAQRWGFTEVVSAGPAAPPARSSQRRERPRAPKLAKRS